MNIETIEDLKVTLKDSGYSNNAINEIIKWYSTKCSPVN